MASILRGRLRYCGSDQPHAAHSLRRYFTQRHGLINEICVGCGPEKGTVIAKGDHNAPAVVDPTPSEANRDNFVMTFQATARKRAK
jgi:hypothetical protein